MSKTYGYMRVSTVDQNEARQLDELLAFGVEPKNIFMDKLSGKDFNRPAYKKLKKKLRHGDLLAVKSIDRLGRNYVDIQDEWRTLTKVIKADVVILDMPLLDTRSGKDLIGALISDIVLQLLSYVAQAEHENIRQRQAEGIAAARLRGKHLGRVAMPLPDEFFHTYDKWAEGSITRAEAAHLLSITVNQFDWMKRKYQKQLNHQNE